MASKTSKVLVATTASYVVRTTVDAQRRAGLSVDEYRATTTMGSTFPVPSFPQRDNSAIWPRRCLQTCCISFISISSSYFIHRITCKQTSFNLLAHAYHSIPHSPSWPSWSNIHPRLNHSSYGRSRPCMEPQHMQLRCMYSATRSSQTHADLNTDHLQGCGPCMG